MNKRCSYSKPTQQLQHTTTTFLPIMFCSRSSLKDVALSHSRRRRDPPSPKCRFSAKVSGVNTPNHSLNSSSDRPQTTAANKPHKLGTLFSAKSLPDKSTSAASAPAAVARSEMLIGSCYYTCGIRSKRGNRKSRADLDWKPPPAAKKPINVAELDPPLPVVRRQLENGIGGVERENLWKRRSRGSALGSLQVHGGANSLHTTPANTV